MPMYITASTFDKIKNTDMLDVTSQKPLFTSSTSSIIVTNDSHMFKLIKTADVTMDGYPAAEEVPGDAGYETCTIDVIQSSSIDALLKHIPEIVKTINDQDSKSNMLALKDLLEKYKASTVANKYLVFE